MSHRFNPIDWQPRHPRIFHESNVSRPENAASDKRAIERFPQGRHDLVLHDWHDEYRRLPWEAFGAHYLQMVGALGGPACCAPGEPLSDDENARGTGNVHVWFDTGPDSCRTDSRLAAAPIFQHHGPRSDVAVPRKEVIQ